MSATSGIVLLEAALPAGIVLPRQLKLPLSMTKLFFDLCWIKSFAMSWKDGSTLMLGNGPEPRIVRN